MNHETHDRPLVLAYTDDVGLGVPPLRHTPRATALVNGRENGAQPWRRSCRAASKLGDQTWICQGIPSGYVKIAIKNGHL